MRKHETRQVVRDIDAGLKRIFPDSGQSVAFAERSRRVLPLLRSVVELTSIYVFDIAPYDRVVEPYSRASIHVVRRLGSLPLIDDVAHPGELSRVYMTLHEWRHGETIPGAVNRRFVDYDVAKGVARWNDVPSGLSGAWNEPGVLQLVESLEGGQALQVQFAEYDRLPFGEEN